ncbi:MAG: CoA-binding protein [Rhodobacterales bacterium]|nr:CoA-binding protein [Rhodobacterales bacterium]
MSTKSRLSRLFSPKSVAVVGGGVWCRSVIEQLIKIGYKGTIFPVHPFKEEILGIKSFKDLEDIPAIIDATFIGVNRNITIEVVKQLNSLNAGGAVCFASGFLEAEGDKQGSGELQKSLIEAAADMPILGPNCYGFINYLDHAALWPDQHGGTTVDKGVAILTQSSNIAINITMQTRGLPISYIMSVGNQASLGFSEIGMYLLSDPRVTSLGLHIEGIGDLKAFEELTTKARKLGKPIVALKVGKSAEARRAAQSHTASLAGDAQSAKSLFKRLGIAEVDRLEVLIDTLKIFHSYGPLSSKNVRSLSCSGGEASLVSDLAQAYGIQFPKLEKENIAELRSVLGEMVALSNPLDYHTYIWGDINAMASTFIAMMRQHNGITIIIVDFPRDDNCDPSAWNCVITAAKMAKKSENKPLALVSTLSENIPEHVSFELLESNIITLHGLDTALAAISVSSIDQMVVNPKPIFLSNPTGKSILVDEYDAKKSLEKYGLKLPETAKCLQSDAHLVSDQIGYPVVIKALGSAHKSEVGEVFLNLEDQKSVKEALRKISKKHVIVEKMIGDAVVELLVGIVHDPAHGMLLTVGAGGVLTEILSDTSSILLPSSKNEVLDCFNQLKISKIAKGYRGALGVDINQIIDAIMKIQDFVLDNRDKLFEIEINPLIVTTSEVIVADALIRKVN